MAISKQFVTEVRALAILPLVGAALAACGGNKVEGTESATVAAVPGGGAIVVETFTSSATVSALNRRTGRSRCSSPTGRRPLSRLRPTW